MSSLTVNGEFGAWLRRMPPLGAVFGAVASFGDGQSCPRRTSAKKRSATPGAAPQLATRHWPLATIFLAAGLALSLPAQAQTPDLSFTPDAIAAQTYAYNVDIGTVTMPVASGGSGELTYALEDANENTRVPPGLSFSANGGTTENPPTLTGTLVNGVDTVFTYTVTDTAGAKKSLPFRIFLSGAPNFGDATQETLTYTQGVEIPPLTLPLATFNRAVDYITIGDGGFPYLRTLGFVAGENAGGFVVTGTPNQAGNFLFYVRAEQGEGSGFNRSRFYVRFVILPAPLSFGSQTIADQTYDYNTDIGTVTLPVASGGSGELTYALEDANAHTGVPAGLVVNKNGGTTENPPTLTGSPISGVNTVFSYTVTDTAGMKASLPLRITIEGVVPNFGDATLEELTYTVGEEIPELTLPMAVGATEYIFENLTPVGSVRPRAIDLGFVASGLTSAGAVQVTGTPTQSGRFEFTLTALSGSITSDSTLLTSFDFYVTILPGALNFGSQTIADQTYDYNTDIGTVTLPVASGGSGELTYALEDASVHTVRPEDLIFSANGGTTDDPPTLTGMFLSGVNAVFTYTATDTAGTKLPLPFRITIRDAPNFGDQTLEEMTYTVGEEITTLALPTASGVTDGSFTITVLFKDDVILNGADAELLSATGLIGTTGANSSISGTPTKSGRFRLWLFVNSAALGSSSIFYFNIVILEAPEQALSFGEQTVADQVYIADEAIDDLTLPDAGGGTSPYSFTLGGNIPSGLSFDADTRILGGTPDTEAVAAPLTFTATDSATSPATQSLIFAITVNAAVTACEMGTSALELSDRVASPGDLGWTVGIAVEVELPYEAEDVAVVADEDRNDIPYYELLNAPTGINLDGVDPADGDDFGFPYIVGTPQEAGAYSMLYRIRDDRGCIQQRILATVIGPLAFNPSTQADKIYTVDTAIPDLTLPDATRGTEPYTFTLEGAPADLSFAADTRILSGIPSPVSDSELSYKVRDAANTEVNLTFAVSVVAAGLRFDPATQADQTYTMGTDIPDLTLPNATSGTSPYTFTLEGAPDGLSFTADTRTLSGAPSTVSDSELSYKVRDADGAEVSLTFTVTALAAGLKFDPATQADQTYTVDTAITDLTLPNAASGTSPYTFTLEGAPAGLSFTADTRTLSGIPSTAGDSELSFTVRDAGDTEVRLTFAIRVDPAPLAFDPDTQADQTYEAESDIPDLTLPNASGGAEPYTFTLGGAPAGLDFDADTRILSGTPTTEGDSDLRFTVRDADGTEISLNFNITILTSLNLDPPTVEDQTFMVDVAIEPLTFPVASEGEPEYSYALDGEVPAGLSFDGDTRVLSGIPTASSNTVVLTYIASDSEDASVSLNFNVMVLPNTLAFADDTTIADQSYTATTAIPPLELPTAMGGIAPLIYTLSGSLPADLSFSGDTDPPSVSGAPSAAAATAELVYTVTDSATVPLSATLSFNIFVAEAPVLTQDALTYTAGFALEDLPTPPILPEIASGGVAPVRYTLGGLPANLSFDPTSRALSGAVDTASSSELTFGATDSNNAAAVVTFTLTINEPISFAEQSGDLHVRNGETYRVDPTSLDLDPALTLPVFSGGDSTFTTVLTGPAGDDDLIGLSFDDTTRTLSGTLESTDAGGDFVWTITDGSGAFTTLNFAIRSAGPYFEDSTQQSDLTFVQGTQASETLLEANISQARPNEDSVSYTLLDADGATAATVLPGLAFASATRILSGTPTAGKNPIALTYTVSDGEGNIDTAIFNVEVIPDPLSFASGATITDQSYTATATITPLQLPIATGGIEALVYTLSSGLPASLSFAADTNPPTISGAPDAATANTQLVYTVTDSSIVALSATLTFNIFVAAPPVLTQGDLTHTAGFALEDLPTPPTLPQIASGGIAPISYAVVGLPANLAFDPASRALTGIAAAAASSTLSFTATDTNTAVATATFTLQIDAPLSFTEEAGDLHVRSGETYRVDPISLSLDPPLTLPAFGGGDNSLSAVLTGPAGDNDLGGLVLDLATRILSGTLRSQDAGGDYVWTVTDGSGAFTTLSFMLRSAGPYFEDSTQQGDLTFVQGEQGSATLLEANTAQAQPDAASVVYTLSDPNGSPLSTILPGLVFDPATRTLSGTPTAGRNPMPLSYTVTDGDSNSETLIFNVEITPSELKFAGAVADQSYVVNIPITPLNLPPAQDGIAGYNYTLGGIPAGLIFDPNATPPTISGAPADDTEGNYSLTYTVTDSAAGAPATASLIFNINIIPLIFVPDSVADQTFTIGTPATLVLPAAAGGTPRYAYTLEELPAGLTLEPNGGTQQDPPTLVGSPEDGTRGNYNLVYTVTDSNRPTNHSLSLNFTLIVREGTAHFNILNRVLLPEVARAVADQNIGAITQRISHVRSNSKSQDPANKLAQANLGGQDSWTGLLHSHGLTLLKGDQLNGRDILSKSHFVLPLNTKRLRHDEHAAQYSANLSLWGAGSYRDISGDNGGVDWEGELSGAHLGVDTLIGKQLLLGFAISQNRSDLNYKFENKSGAHQIDMTNFNPYFSWASENERLEVWITAGFGLGELEIDDDNVTDTATSDVDMFSLGAGMRGTLLNTDNRVQLRLRGDTLQASLEVKESEHIDSLQVNVSRARLALELAGSLTLFGGAHLQPLLELGLRHDGDDGDERSAMELGFALRHHIPHLGLSTSGRVHILVGPSNYNEYGAHASLQLQPNLTKGLSLNLSSGYGADANPDVQQIWQRDLSLDPTSTPHTPDKLRYKARLSYNIPTNTRRHHTQLSPYTEYTLDTLNSHTLGLNWTLPSATLQLEWTNKQEEAPETEIKARFRF